VYAELAVLNYNLSVKTSQGKLNQDFSVPQLPQIYRNEPNEPQTIEPAFCLAVKVSNNLNLKFETIFNFNLFFPI